MASKMTRPPLARMMRIHEELRRNTLTNCSRLVKELEVCRKTVVRDIAFMRDQLNLPIEYDGQIKAYRYSHPVRAFPTVQVTEGELMALLVAQRALEQYRGTPFHRQLSVAFGKLTAGLKDQISFSVEDELQSVSFKNAGTAKNDDVTFSALSSAVLRQEEVVFEYKKPGSRKTENRQVQPYHLTHRENLWYLVGRDVGRDALRTFAVPRISAVEPTRKRFTRPADFTPEGFFANALGVLGGQGDFKIVLHFDAELADRVREREWHESQSVAELPDGAIEVRLRLGALAEVERWILGWGSKVTVLSPPELRDRVSRVANALAERYHA